MNEVINNKYKIYLASASPRRKEILQQAGLEFNVITPECDENINEDRPWELVMKLSLKKAQAGYSMLSSFDSGLKTLVIGADTIVCLDGRILGKPEDDRNAFEMLKSLSGRTHEVYTGVTVLTENSAETFYEMTEVSFYDVPDEDILDYIKTGEPADKAGAYGIQGKGCFLVKGIRGDYFNVMGLPAAHLLRVLKGSKDE